MSAPDALPVATQRMGRQGGLPALLAHCFLGHSGGWEELVQAVEPPLEALAFDMPGHGRSPPWDDPTGSGDYQADVTAILSQLIDGHADDHGQTLLIGHSFGATVALRHALARPETVRALVMFEPVFFAAVGDDPEFVRYLETEAPLRAAFAAGDMEEAARAFMQLNGDAPVWEGLPEKQRARFAAQMKLIAASRAGVFDDSGRQLAPGRMQDLRVPVLLLAGERSPPIFAAIARALASRLGRAEQQSVAGAGHMMPITHAGECARLISGWMARNGMVGAASARRVCG